MVLVWVFRKNTNKDGLTGNGRTGDGGRYLGPFVQVCVTKRGSHLCFWIHKTTLISTAPSQWTPSPSPSLSTFPSSASFPQPYPKSRLYLQSGILGLCPSTKKGPSFSGFTSLGQVSPPILATVPRTQPWPLLPKSRLFIESTPPRDPGLGLARIDFKPHPHLRLCPHKPRPGSLEGLTSPLLETRPHPLGP